MKDNLILFENIEWDTPHPGAEQKTYTNENRTMRLLIFRDNFIEHDWCMKGHIGFVLRGQMTLNFNGQLLNYKKGDGLWIHSGQHSKHKVIIEKGGFVELILFEDND